VSTRGCFGFHRNGKDELYYNHWDSYPDGLGRAFISYLKGKDEDNWIGEILANPDARNDEFIRDSLYCEYAYILNKDTNELEVYRGFQESPPEGRYHDCLPFIWNDIHGKRHSDYACGLLTIIHMDTINHFSTDELIEFILDEENERRKEDD